jgi:hypothetical protein
VGEISLTALLPPSATSRLAVDLSNKATARGFLKVARVPVPSTNPPVPDPAIVVTTPAGVDLRIKCVGLSGQYRVPVLPSTTMPLGPFTRAATPVPSTEEQLCASPMKVVTTPKGVTLRMVQAPSVTRALPVWSSATPTGFEKEAEVPVPSLKPPDTPPASVATVPEGDSVLRAPTVELSSTIYRTPEGAYTTPKGAANFAEVAAPSPQVLTPGLPANRLTTPKGLTLRTTQFLASATT